MGWFKAGFNRQPQSSKTKIMCEAPTLLGLLRGGLHLQANNRQAGLPLFSSETGASLKPTHSLTPGQAVLTACSCVPAWADGLMLRSFLPSFLP